MSSIYLSIYLIYTCFSPVKIKLFVRPFCASFGSSSAQNEPITWRLLPLRENRLLWWRALRHRKSGKKNTYLYESGSVAVCKVKNKREIPSGSCSSSKFTAYFTIKCCIMALARQRDDFSQIHPQKLQSKAF